MKVRTFMLSQESCWSYIQRFQVAYVTVQQTVEDDREAVVGANRSGLA